MDEREYGLGWDFPERQGRASPEAELEEARPSHQARQTPHFPRARPARASCDRYDGSPSNERGSVLPRAPVIRELAKPHGIT